MAVTLIADVVHVNTVEPVLFVMPAVGAVISCVTVMLAVDVQPPAAVTVTVYVPGVVMLADADEPKLLFHEYDTPPVAVTLIAVVVQVNTVEPVLFVIPAVGDELMVRFNVTTLSQPAALVPVQVAVLFEAV